MARAGILLRSARPLCGCSLHLVLRFSHPLLQRVELGQSVSSIDCAALGAHIPFHPPSGTKKAMTKLGGSQSLFCRTTHLAALNTTFFNTLHYQVSNYTAPTLVTASKSIGTHTCTWHGLPCIITTYGQNTQTACMYVCW